MKKKFIRWILRGLLKFVDAETKVEAFREMIDYILLKLYEEHPTPYLLDREIANACFDAKYDATIKDLGLDEKPSTILTSYYERANKGDNTFMTSSFYRVLRQTKDSEVRKLRYRVKRSQK